MNDFMSQLSDLLGIISDFLMSEPICYFIGIMLLVFIARLADYIMHGRRCM